MGRDQPISYYEGGEVDHEDGDEDGDGDGAGLGGGVDGDSGGGWRRPLEVIPAAFPPSDLLRRQPSVFSFVVLCRLLLENIGGLFMQSVLGHEDSSGRRIVANRATRAKIGGPTRLQYQAAWDPPFCPSGLCLLASFGPRSYSFQNNDPHKFIAHLDVVWVSETSKYRK